MAVYLDFSLGTGEARKKFVDELVAERSARDGVPLTQSDIAAISDYLLFTTDAKQTGKERRTDYPILTRNRMATVSRREVSYEVLGENGFETAEEAVSAAAGDFSDFNLDKKCEGFAEGVEDNDVLSQNVEIVENLKKQLANAVGKRRYDLKRQIISKYREQQMIKSSHAQHTPSLVRTGVSAVPFHYDEEVRFDQASMLPVSSSPASLLNPQCVYRMLNNYHRLKGACEGDFEGDLAFLMMDLDEAVDEAFSNEPVFARLVELKKRGLQNDQVAKVMKDEFALDRAEGYWSGVWASRIPKMVSHHVAVKWLIRHYEDPLAGKWKTCTRCGKTKLAHPEFFNRNTSPDGYYSICRQCRTRHGGRSRVSVDSEQALQERKGDSNGA